ncbi:hypothetical protein LGK95_03840 [Clostridium algoriphilum]|uniref:hypothetical protein n=1 Tax=Clostridium algoriphilum TaxID=198347 RepID=UPI001CF443FE|nr:hypothetical protein [Clostridium algoriphilum]MCB2292668.1 hypothetical protein [Clostridium algoriphilum]
MRNMKKYLSLLLGLIIIFSLTSCLSKSKNDSTTDGSKVIADKKIADAEIIANKKIADAEIVANKKISDAKIAADDKISNEKSKETTLASVSSTEQPEQFIYKNYINYRYQFSIMYPNTLTLINDPDNGDGRELKSIDGKVVLTIYGSNNILNETIDSMYHTAIQSSNLPYKKQSGDWYVISYIEGDDIIYEKTVVGKGSINTFVFKYPTNQKDKYSNVVERLNKSFKTPSTNEGH